MDSERNAALELTLALINIKSVVDWQSAAESYLGIDKTIKSGGYSIFNEDRSDETGASPFTLKPNDIFRQKSLDEPEEEYSGSDDSGEEHQNFLSSIITCMREIEETGKRASPTSISAMLECDKRAAHRGLEDLVFTGKAEKKRAGKAFSYALLNDHMNSSKDDFSQPFSKEYLENMFDNLTEDLSREESPQDTTDSKPQLKITKPDMASIADLIIPSFVSDPIKEEIVKLMNQLNLTDSQRVSLSICYKGNSIGLHNHLKGMITQLDLS